MKVGIIVEGGGMKCAYSAGVLDGFLDYGFQFDYAIGVSAGAANLVSFLGYQRERNKRFYIDHIKEPNYLSLSSYVKTGNYFNLQYIYGDLTNEGGGDPADYQAMTENPTPLYYPATDAETGKPHYFSKMDNKPQDYRPIMATCALPVLCQPVEIDGHFYYDGGVSDSIPIQKALDDGCEKLVIISSKPRSYVKPPEKHKAAYTLALKRRFPKMVEALDRRHIMYNEEFQHMLALEKEGKAFLFFPSEKHQIKTTSKDPSVMEAMYQDGLRDAGERAEALREFMKNE